MNQQDLIARIEKASKIEDVISIANFKTEFDNIVKEIHPDKCSLPGASEATAKMNVWRDVFENGKEYFDDASTFRTNGYWAEYRSDKKNLAWSIENYRRFKHLTGPANDHFQKYIPATGKLLSDGTFRYEFTDRSIPLSGLQLPQEHVNWVLSRLLEYCAYFAEIGFSHCGLNPESVFIVPETHGIQVCSFYHLTKLGNKIGTISGKYSAWYPPETFHTKEATMAIDIELSKKIAAYLLGDPSGSAVKLRKTHNEDFVNFLVSASDNSYKTFTTYKELLKKNFKKQFHSLTI